MAFTDFVDAANKRWSLGEPDGTPLDGEPITPADVLEHFLADLNRRGIPKGLEF
jgi:hypothetical protein